MISKWYGGFRTTVLLGVLVLGVPSSGLGYEEVAVTSGGSITGKVVLNGTPPPARIFHMVFSPNIDFCSRISDGKGNRLLKEFQVSPDGGFQNVVVAVVGVPRGKRFDYTPEISLDTCQVGPFVIPIRNQYPIRIVNKDPVTHDLQAYTLRDDYTFEMFNKPMIPQSVASKEIVLRKNHYIFRTQCGVHDFMQSWGMAVGNPYFAVTGADGSFTIPDLPPGTYDVIAWHPYMKVQAQKVTVPADGKVTLNFQFETSEVHIPLYNLQTRYRLQTALEKIPLKPPAVELQVP
ncbi:MAG TPA: carboxypeptidase-like regulatory domain-containing protein [Nitrospiria bacterium]|nr:carboxypeptidase-like regulatory domain-containing protein [Nitrospiria bacterium]